MTARADGKLPVISGVIGDQIPPSGTPDKKALKEEDAFAHDRWRNDNLANVRHNILVVFLYGGSLVLAVLTLASLAISIQSAAGHKYESSLVQLAHNFLSYALTFAAGAILNQLYSSKK